MKRRTLLLSCGLVLASSVTVLSSPATDLLDSLIQSRSRVQTYAADARGLELHSPVS